MIIKTAKKLDFTSNEEFFNYIIESYINGQKSQFIKLMTNFINETSFEKQIFQMCIISACNTFGLRTTIDILKKYYTFEYSISDNTIINVFYDNSRNELNEVKEILINNF